MVHLPTLQAQTAYYEKNKGNILDPTYRFAVISENNHILFKTREELYAKHPYFAPDAPARFGTLPKLVDIAKELNLPEYKREILDLQKTIWDEKFTALMEEHEEIVRSEESLEGRL